MSYDSAPNQLESSANNDGRKCRSIEWYSDGQARIVEVGDVRIEVRFVGRHGRRARISIIAPFGASFMSD